MINLIRMSVGEYYHYRQMFHRYPCGPFSMRHLGSLCAQQASLFHLECKERFRVLKRFSQVIFYLKFWVVLKLLEFFVLFFFLEVHSCQYFCVIVCFYGSIWQRLAGYGRTCTMTHWTVVQTKGHRSSQTPWGQLHNSRRNFMCL